MKKHRIVSLFIILFIMLILAISGCVKKEKTPVSAPIPEAAPIPETEVSASATNAETAPPRALVCTKNSECTGGKICLDGSCQTLQEVYAPVANCAKKCNYNTVTLLTSDQETYTLKKGEGSYSYAGALEWKVKVLSDYCQGQEPKVAVQFLKKNAGKILEETYLTLGAGETSPLVTHPTIKRVQFKVTVNNIQETCS